MNLNVKKLALSQPVPLYLSILGFALNLIAYYPGFMSADSISQYEQAIFHKYGDWHPPIMSLLWSFLNIFSKGPQLMLVLQLFFLWTSFYLLSRSWFSSKRSYLILFFCFLLAPFIQNIAGYIIKDGQMGLAFLLSFCIMVKAEYNKRTMTRAEAIFSFVLMVYGSLVRLNAMPAVLPLLFLWFGNYTRWRSKSFTVIYTTFSIFLILIIQSFINTLAKPEKQFVEYKLLVHDIAGVYVKTGKNYLPSFITQYPGYDSVYLKNNYTTATLDNLWWNWEKKISFPPMTETNMPILQNAWQASILENPKVYLKNKFEGFLYFLHVKERTKLYWGHPTIDQNPYGITFKGNFISKGIINSIEFQSEMVYMKPWFWMLLNLVILALSFFISHADIKRLVLILSISSLFYILPQFFIFQVDTDFRYFYWNCIALFLSICFIVKDQRFKALH